MNIVSFIIVVFGIGMNLIALKLIAITIKRFGLAEKSRYVERMLRKARVSGKKMVIASRYVKKFRGSMLKLSILQFVIPISIFMTVSLVTSLITPAIPLRGTCLAPPPIEVFDDVKQTCYANTVWLQFLVFLIFSPWYSFLARQLMEKR